MCGAINLVAVVNHSSKRNLKRPILYNLGRVISYTLLGGIVGVIGNILSVDEKVSGIIIISTAIIMFLMALNMLGILNFKNFKVFQGKFFQEILL